MVFLILFLTTLWSLQFLSKDYKKYISQLVNITIDYLNYNFVARYYNCIVLKIEKINNNKDFLFVLTADGETKPIILYDPENIKVNIHPV